MLGSEARMDEEERKMIEDPMARIFERMDPGAMAMLEKYSDPVLLAFGFMTWGIRVWAELSMGGNDDEPRSGFDKVDRGPIPPSNGREKKEPLPTLEPEQPHETVIVKEPSIDVTEHINEPREVRRSDVVYRAGRHYAVKDQHSVNA